MSPKDRRPAPKDVPLIPDRATEDRDEGWSEGSGATQFSDDWYAEQRPPHW